MKRKEHAAFAAEGSGAMMIEQNENATLEEIYRALDEKLEQAERDPGPLVKRPPRRPPQKPKRRGCLPLLIVGVLLAAGLIFALTKLGGGQTPSQTEPPTLDATSPTGGSTVVTIAAGGDVNITPEILSQLRKPDGTYDFSGYFLAAAPLLSQADVAAVNLEAVFTDQTTGDTSRNAPAALAEALAQMGVDVVQTANSYSILQGLAGLSSTMETIRNAGMQTAGTCATAAEYAKTKGVTLVEVKGLKIAFVAFTKGVGNLNLPEGGDHSVNLLYRDYSSTYSKVDTAQIQTVLDAAKALNPDITIALLHWGSEYDQTVSSTQETIRKLLLSNGVNAIIGTHPHIVGPIVEENGTLTAYSIGDLCGLDQDRNARQSLILELEFTKDNETGEVRLTGYHYTPLYLATSEESPTGRCRILNVDDEISLYDSGYYTKVSQDVYETLQKTKERLEKRTAPPEKETAN